MSKMNLVLAARRLIIVMLVLLGFSTALAVIVPDPRERDPEEETSSPTGTTGATGDTGSSGSDEPETSDPNLAVETVTANEKDGDPPVATAQAAGRLVLTVKTGGPADISIPDLGRTAAATKYAPAVFDLILPTEAGRFKVVDVDDGETIAEIKTKG